MSRAAPVTPQSAYGGLGRLDVTPTRPDAGRRRQRQFEVVRFLNPSQLFVNRLSNDRRDRFRGPLRGRFELSDLLVVKVDLNPMHPVENTRPS